MISPSTIAAVFAAADIVDIIGSAITLKRKGTNHEGLCPFHNEKTPSFMVSPAKGIYKCFGCGAGGNAVNFIINHHKKTYPEAIEYLADRYNIPIEYDKTTTTSTETKDTKKEMHALLKWCATKYEAALYTAEAAPALQYLHSRGYTNDRIKMWGIGFAPLQDFKYITTPIINMGKHTIAEQLGIIKTTNGTSRDFLINRITIPIHDAQGTLTGFAGRIYTAQDSKWPKWINPPNSLLYQKGQQWYGLHTAQKAIQQQGFAYLVEGYPDTHAMQDNGLTNTIAPCGKEIADEQIKYISRFTKHICFIPNIDANQSGQQAVLKHINRFIAAGIRTSVIHLPQCNDADEYINHLLNQKLQAV